MTWLAVGPSIPRIEVEFNGFENVLSVKSILLVRLPPHISPTYHMVSISYLDASFLAIVVVL